jgi:hypothetical protein
MTVTPQSSSGSDPVPPAAAEVGFTSQTFRWGPGDTLDEIDGGETYVPGYKFYLDWNQRGFGAASYSMVNGELHVQAQTTGVSDYGGGPFILNTCGYDDKTGNIVIGNRFGNGFYWEFNATWHQQPGGEGNAGAYGVSAEWGQPGFPFVYELDNPDTFGFGLNVARWRVSPQEIVDNSPRYGIPNPSDQDNVKFGVRSTATAIDFYRNDVYVTSVVNWPPEYILEFYNQHQCLGIMAGSSYPTIVHSFNVWQAPSSGPSPVPPPTPPSGLSPDGSAATGPNGSLITADGTWTFGVEAPGRPGEWHILLNGVDTTAIASWLKLKGGHIFVLTASGQWYVWANGTWTLTTDPGV